MSITRTTDTDDDGSGTTGTIHNNAWLQALYDAVDARWSVATTTSTGSQNDLSFSQADLFRCNNASALTITGLTAPASPAKNGKRLVIAPVGAGTVSLADQSGSSTAANRIITGIGTTLVLNGPTLLVYDDDTDRWRVLSHHTIDWTFTTYTPTWSSSGGTPVTVGNSTTTGRYKRSGKKIDFDISFTFGSTSAQGTGNTWLFSLPTTADGTSFGSFAATVFDAGTGSFAANATMNSATTVSMTRGDSAGDGTITGNNSPIATWATGDSIKISGWYYEA